MGRASVHDSCLGGFSVVQIFFSRDKRDINRKGKVISELFIPKTNIYYHVRRRTRSVERIQLGLDRQ